MQGVVPVGQRVVRREGDCGGLHIGLRDGLASGVFAALQPRRDAQPGGRRRGADEVQGCRVTDEGLPGPSLGDLGEEPVVDGIPLGGPRGIGGRPSRSGHGDRTTAS